MVLLTGAGLLIASFAQLRSVDPGFDAADVLTIGFPRTPQALSDAAAIWSFERAALERLRALPGVTAAAGTNTLPLERGWNIPTQPEGRPELSFGATEWRAITPGYFRTLRMPLARGREFTPADARGGAPVAIVNESLARQFWPGEDALGQHILVGYYQGEALAPEFAGVSRRVVAVVADARDRRLDVPAIATVYVPQAQAESGMAGGLPHLLVRAPAPAGLAAAARRVVLETDPRVPAPEMRTLEQVIGASLTGERFNTLLMSLLAGLALVLTAVGIYAVVSYSVNRRTREIGVRMALGARPRSVLRLVLRQGLTPVAAGLLVGIGASLLLTRLITGMLYDVEPRDPLAFGATALLFAAVAAAAACVPAWRATRVDPVVAFRAE